MERAAGVPGSVAADRIPSSSALERRPSLSMVESENPNFSAAERSPAFSALVRSLSCSTLVSSLTGTPPDVVPRLGPGSPRGNTVEPCSQKKKIDDQRCGKKISEETTIRN